MIKLKFEPPKNKRWRKWLTDGAAKHKQHHADYTIGKSIKIDGAFYKRFKGPIYFNNKAPFFGKCAFCEQTITSSQHGDIEHFRPKGKVTDENDAVITFVNDNGATVPHPGYYWLAYDWKNLLASCQLCNQPSSPSGERLGKRNRFPVAGGYAVSPSDNLDDALLINPLFDDPSEHLELISETGALRGITAKGQTTIKVLGLNSRGLPEQRLEAYGLAKMRLAQSVMLDMNNNTHLVERLIETWQRGEPQFAFVLRRVLSEFLDRLRQYVQE